MIKKADKNSKELSTLIVNAIGDVAQTLTAQSDMHKILQTLDAYICMDVNRLSHNNIYVYEIQNRLAGLVVAYDASKIKQLDAPILSELQSQGIYLESLEQECFSGEFYIDTLSVFEIYWGRGIAKKLLLFIEKKAKDDGFTKLSLLVETQNHKALRLYEKVGFCKNRLLSLSNHHYHHMIKYI